MNNAGQNKILIADDIKANVTILKKLLEKEYDLVCLFDGQSVIKYVASNSVDLILLDILMPGMDGYEVCRHLKADERTKNIPIIFITSKSKDEDETLGLDLGAVDYITKPFSYPVVKARIKTQLALINAVRELESQNEMLREAAVLREDVERITRHDLKNPLVAIIGYSELSLIQENLPQVLRRSLTIIKDSGYKMLEMINLSLDLFKMERKNYQLNAESVDVLSVIRKIVQETSEWARTKGVTIDIEINGTQAVDNDVFTIQSEELLCYSMMSNLIKNAIEASPHKEKVIISLDEDDEFLISIHNKGAVPLEVRDIFFDKYSTAGKKKGTGLGTYSAKLIVKTHGGNIDFKTSEESGTIIWARLPKQVK